MRKKIATLVFMILISSCFISASAKEKTFESITDEYMAGVLQDDSVVGLAVCVVKDGNILFEKGYGYSDLDNKVLVSPDQTVFQIASVSKLFTATVVMQLVEQGKLSLDEDVNHYLSAFQIENPFKTSVTLRTLLTHTSGIDDRMPLYIQSNGTILFKDMPELETVLKENLAPVVNEPGTLCQYNVFGMALAGYLVEVASNMPIDQYISQNIFLPLGMQHSSYGLTDNILPYMSKPYHYNGTNYTIGNYTLINDHPSGSICASASDMGKFMLAHLNNHLLSPETEELMQSHQIPKENNYLTGYGLGFYEAIRNGHRTIEHGGNLPYFRSKLSLFPEKNLGVFITLNTTSKTSSRIPNEYIDMFYEYFTESNKSEPVFVPFDMKAKEINGQYSGGYGMTDFTKIKSVLEVSKIDCDENGNLTYLGEGEKWNFGYVGDGMFYCNENANYLRLTKESGEWVLTVLGHNYTKVPTANRIFFILTVCSLPFFIVSIIVLSFLVIRRKNDIPFLLLSLLIVIYVILNAFIPFQYVSGDTGSILTVIKPFIPIVCYSSVLLLVFSLISVIRTWRNKEQHLVKKIWISMITLSAAFCIVFMYLMNGFVW